MHNSTNTKARLSWKIAAMVTAGLVMGIAPMSTAQEGAYPASPVLVDVMIGPTEDDEIAAMAGALIGTGDPSAQWHEEVSTDCSSTYVRADAWGWGHNRKVVIEWIGDTTQNGKDDAKGHTYLYRQGSFEQVAASAQSKDKLEECRWPAG